MARKLRAKDLTVLNSGAYALSTLVSYKVLLVTLAIGDVNLSGQISQIPGLPIAALGVFITFAIGAVFRRTRKHWDTLDKVSVILSFVLPVFTFFVTPVREFIFAEPVVGLVGAVLMVVPYALFVER